MDFCKIDISHCLPQGECKLCLLDGQSHYENHPTPRSGRRDFKPDYVGTMLPGSCRGMCHDGLGEYEGNLSNNGGMPVSTSSVHRCSLCEKNSICEDPIAALNQHRVSTIYSQVPHYQTMIIASFTMRKSLNLRQIFMLMFDSTQ